MGHLKEPKGVDFIIDSKPLSEKDKKEISNYIAKYKANSRKKRNVKTKLKSKLKQHA